MTIKVKLSPSGIQKAKEEIQQYKAQVNARLQEFVRRLADEGREIAEVKFFWAAYDGGNDVKVEVTQSGTKARIIASGKTVLFIEFGTGHNYPEHPSGLYAHGEYGKGKAGQPPYSWVYTGEQGTGGKMVREGAYRTDGNPPAEAMWSAAQAMAERYRQIWQEVMRGD